jgi:N,N'-diacetyllegionaminate synthase
MGAGLSGRVAELSVSQKIRIAGRAIGNDEPAFIIAEAGVNHNGQVSLAFELIEAAANAGADAVKFQTFIAEELATAASQKADYQKQSTKDSESQLEMIRRLELSFADFEKLKNRCDELSITFLSTPFDFQSVDFLTTLGVPAFKISSGDLTNHPLLDLVGRKDRPVILSTGMSDLEEVREAVEVVKSTGNDQVALMQCVTNYPANAADVNLRAMSTMSKAFEVPVGYSDHTLGIEVALAATALGACMIEKHFTIDRQLAGPDHRASLEPKELQAMVAGIRKVEAALGDGIKAPAKTETANALVARRSIVANRDIPAGSTLSRDAITFKRPGTGLPPKMLQQVVGHTARVDVKAGELLRLDMFD